MLENLHIAGLETFPNLTTAITDTVEAMSHLGKGTKSIDVLKVAMSGLGNVLKANPLLTAAAGISAIIAIANIQGQAFQDKIYANNQLIADSEAVHDSSLSLYELYMAYRQASEAADGTASSTQAVASAAEALAAALGTGKSAIDGATQSYKDLTAAQLESALVQAEIGKNAAITNLKSYGDATNIRSKSDSTYGYSEEGTIPWYMEEFGIEYNQKTMGDIEKAEAMVDLYEGLIDRQAEITEELRGSKKSSTPELQNITEWINVLKPYVDQYLTAAQNYEDAQAMLDDVVNDMITITKH